MDKDVCKFCGEERGRFQFKCGTKFYGDWIRTKLCYERQLADLKQLLGEAGKAIEYVLSPAFYAKNRTNRGKPFEALLPRIRAAITDPSGNKEGL